jgi:hypothetical protein
MGYTLNPIAVDLDEVAGALGSKNKRLLSSLVKKYGREFEDLDDAVAEFFEDEEIDDDFTARDALRQMIMGEPYRKEPGLGFVYGYVLEYLCCHFGELLPNEYWRTTSGWWPQQRADLALEALGVDEKVLRASRLYGGGSPVPLPEIDDYPSIGYLRVEEIRSALEAFDEAKLAAIEDPDTRGALGVLRGWLRTCAESGRDLICFED